MKEGIDKNKLLLLREFVVAYMNTFSIFPIYLFLVGITHIDRRGLLPAWLFAGMIPFLFYLLRMKMEGFFPFMLSHLLVLGAEIFLFRGIPVGIMVIIVSALFMLNSVIIRFFRSDFLDDKVSIFVTGGIALLCSVLMETVAVEVYREQLSNLLLLGFVFSFGLFLFSIYFEKFINFLVVNRSSAGHMPVNQIFQSGTSIAAGCILFFMLVMILSSGISFFSYVLSFLKRIAVAVIRFLLKFLVTDSPVPETEEQDIITRDFSPGFDRFQASPSPFWDILTVIISVAIGAVFLYVLFQAARKLGKFVIQRMKYKVVIREDDKSLDDVEDVREKCTDMSAKYSSMLSDLMPSLFLSPNQKIRHFYKTYVRKRESALDPEKPSFLTALECTDLLEKSGMSEIYDRARYSGEECNGLDFKKMKEIAHNKSAHQA